MRVLVLAAAALAVATVAGTPGRLPWQRNRHYEAGVLLRVLPSSGFMYTEGSGANLTAYWPMGRAITTSRSSTRTCTLSDAGIVSIAANRPCIAGNPLGLYAGMQVQNSALHSEEFDNASWTKSNVTVTADVATAPMTSPISNMDLLAGTAVGGYVQAANTMASNNSGAASVYAMSADGGTQSATIQLWDTDAGVAKCTSNFTAGPSVSRASCNVTPLASGAYAVRVYPGGTGGQGSIIAWGGQESIYPFLLGMDHVQRYVPTAGSSVTSQPDLVTTPNFAPIDGYCLAATVSPVVGGTSLEYVFSLGNTQAANHADITTMANNGTAYSLSVTDATNTARIYSANNTPTGETRYCGCAYGGVLSLYRNGVAAAGSGTDAGTGIMGAAPSTIRFSAVDANHVGSDVKMRDFAIGTSSKVCLP